MFPYSFGVQAATKEEAVAELTEQIHDLAEQYPDLAEKFSAHLGAVHAAATALMDLLPKDDPDKPSDVAISAAGHLILNDSDEVKLVSVHIAAERRPTDVSKYPKKRKDQKPAEALSPTSNPPAANT